MCKKTLTSLAADRQKATARLGAVAVLHRGIDKSNYNVHVSAPVLHNSQHDLEQWPDSQQILNLNVLKDPTFVMYHLQFNNQ